MRLALSRCLVLSHTCELWILTRRVLTCFLWFFQNISLITHIGLSVYFLELYLHRTGTHQSYIYLPPDPTRNACTQDRCFDTHANFRLILPLIFTTHFHPHSVVLNVIFISFKSVHLLILLYITARGTTPITHWVTSGSHGMHSRLIIHRELAPWIRNPQKVFTDWCLGRSS